jgi:uncharacterized membrane protein SpoIIM required for sporulation
VDRQPRKSEDPLEPLADLLARAERGGLARLSAEELYLLPRLYRLGASRIALEETRRSGSIDLVRARALVARAHALLHRGGRGRGRRLARALHFFLHEVPATIRAERKVLALSFLALYGFALLAFAAVRSDLEIAFALLPPEAVSEEIRQLEQTAAGEPFRGNFTFGLGQSPLTSGWIIAHNVGIGILFFASGLLPPLFALLIATNGLMLGTYTAVAGHWNQGLEISSILWCHGVLELQAFVLAGAAGLILVRAWIAPGPWSRRHAMSLESARAWRLLAPVFPMLFLAGMIEGFVSPHAPPAARLATAIGSGLALVVWVLAGGRSRAIAIAD